MISILLDFVGVGIVLPLLPFYAQYFQASAFEVGLLLGIYPLLSVLAPALWGHLSDRIGRRPALIFNIAGTALSYIILSQANSLEVLFCSRLLAGVSSASIVIAQAYVADLTTPKQRAKVLSFLEASVGVGFILGPVIGGILLGGDSANPNFRLPGLVAAIAAMVTLIFTCLALPPLPSSNQHDLSSAVADSGAGGFSIIAIYRDVKVTLQRPLMLPIMLWVFMTMFVSIGVQVIFPLWSSQRFGWGAQEYAYLVVIFSLLTAIIQLGLTGRLVNWIGERNLALISLGSAALGLLFISLSTSVIQFSGAVIFSIFAQATCSPALTSLISQLAASKQQGKTLGLMQSVTAMAGFVGATWVGFAFDKFGENWPLWINFGLLVLALGWGWQRVSTDELSALRRHRRQAKLKHLFEVLDYDHSGTINLQDFRLAGRQLAMLKGWTKGGKESVLLENMFLEVGSVLQDLADYDNDGRINQSEWLRLFERKINHDFTGHFLKLIDINQDQQVSMEELRLFYEAYGIDIENIEWIFQTLDSGQDGYLSHSKFRENFEQFIYSDDIQVSGTWLFGVRLPQRL